MKSVIIDRFREVKNRILFYLEAIKEAQDINDTRIVSLIVERADDQCKQLAGIASVIDQNAAEVKELLEYVRPSNEPYRYSQEASEYRLENPEIALAQYMRTFLPVRTALDVGANKGHVSELLLSAGYLVYAFEPNRDAFAALNARFEGRPDFQAFPLAISDCDGEMTLFTAHEEGSGPRLDADKTVYSSLVQHPTPTNMNLLPAYSVAVKSLGSMITTKDIPDQIGLLKVDTEGHDLAVLRGLSNGLAHMVIAEFWDTEHFFSDGKVGTIDTLVAEMRSRGYLWHIVVFRSFKLNKPRFYCNLDQSVRGSWGNVVFFRDIALFREAFTWCRSNMAHNETFL